MSVAAGRTAVVVGLVFGCLALPALAMPQCPVEPDRPAATVALGYAVLALAAGLGLAAPLFTWRRTRTSPPSLRALWLGVAGVGMFGIWLAGLGLWLRVFVWPC